MAWDPSRRVFLKGAGLAAVGIGLGPSSLMVRAAEAATSGPGVLVKVFLRGGCDGLNLLVPHGEPEYYNLRQGIAIRDAVALDSYFGLNPALSSLRQLYADGRLAFVTAVGNYGLTRSHFDAQDFMETGTPGDKTTGTGWLDRSIAAIPGTEVTQAVSFSSQVPRSYMGGEPVLVAQNLTQFDLRARNWRDEAERQLRAMYGPLQTPVGRTGQETFAAMTTILRTPELVAPPANGAAYPAGTIGSSLRQAAQVIKAGLGTRSIYVNVPGAFDTHSNQLFNNTLEFQRIGDALLAFQTDLGRAMDDVVLLVTTEFGRTAAVNGSAGTDHGSGYTMIVMGGGVRGGRVYGQWPGLRRDQLYQQRDLAVTTDFRDVFAEIARAQLGVPASTLFPGYTAGAGPGIVG
ncbi:MAG TPA: DUF1501 domain-containing protein [Vicinamibacteria bacterium]|nr:DUF1501 domain-containing protein [Vicinamibacteria bacterium]